MFSDFLIFVVVPIVLGSLGYAILLFTLVYFYDPMKGEERRWKQ